MKQWRRLARHGARAVMLLLGALLLGAVALYPAMDSSYVSVNDGRTSMEPLVSGDVLTQTVELPGGVTQFSLQASSVKDAKALTLSIALMQGERVVAEQEFPLAKVKAKGRLIVDVAGVRPGTYTLQVTASGEGSVKLAGGVQTAALVSGQTRETGCALRLTCVKKQYNPAVLFSGGLMLLLALTPSGGKEAARHA